MAKRAAGEIRGYCSAGQYLQGPGVVKEVPGKLAKFGTKALMLVDPFFYTEETLGMLKEMFRETGAQVLFEKFGGECCQPEIDRLKAVIAAQPDGVDAVIGFGAGKTLDTCRCIVEHTRIPLILVATAVATNAPTSSLAVVYEEDHSSHSMNLMRNPEFVLIDTAYVIQAPARMIAAGIGDALSTYYEGRNNWLSNNVNYVRPGYRYTLCSKAIAEACIDILVEQGRQAVTAAKHHIRTKDFEDVVEAVSLLSGIGWETNGCSIAHGIGGAIPTIPECQKYLHGEHVAYGVLVQMLCDGIEEDEFLEVYSLCEDVGLPTKLADLGLPGEEGLQKFADCINRVFDHEDDFHIVNYPITAEVIINAARFLETYAEED